VFRLTQTPCRVRSPKAIWPQCHIVRPRSIPRAYAAFGDRPVSGPADQSEVSHFVRQARPGEVVSAWTQKRTCHGTETRTINKSRCPGFRAIYNFRHQFVARTTREIMRAHSPAFPSHAAAGFLARKSKSSCPFLQSCSPCATEEGLGGMGRPAILTRWAMGHRWSGPKDSGVRNVAY